MKAIKYIISNILNKNNNIELIDSLGYNLTQVFNDIYKISPKSSYVESISFVFNKKIISSIFFVLKEPVKFSEVRIYFSNNYTCLYNHFDDETWVNFREYNKNFNFHAIKGGYIDKKELDKISFQRFEIRFIK